MHLRCFVEGLVGAAGEAAGGRVVRLPEEEARHARMSRRLSVGDALELFDGLGHEANATISAVSRGAVEVSVGPLISRPRSRPMLKLAVAMPKAPRQDALVEKCTELVGAAIPPLITERPVAVGADHKLARWRRTTIEAAKQSGQCWLPELRPPLILGECLRETADFDLILAALLGRGGTTPSILDLAGQIHAARSVLAFIGPEGDFSPPEAQALLAAGARPVSLGPNVLRIETAALAVAAVVHACTRERNPTDES